MRNTGWYIPFWRKPKRAAGEGGQPEKGEKAEKRRRPRTRTDAELEQVRAAWVDRYTNQVRALRVLGLSVGVPRDEVAERYRDLVSALDGVEGSERQLRELRDAYEILRQD